MAEVIVVSLLGVGVQDAIEGPALELGDLRTVAKGRAGGRARGCEPSTLKGWAHTEGSWAMLFPQIDKNCLPQTAQLTKLTTLTVNCWEKNDEKPGLLLLALLSTRKSFLNQAKWLLGTNAQQPGQPLVVAE